MKYAIKNNNYEVVNLLLDSGFDIHLSYDAAIRFAVRYNKLDMVKLLLERGADINAWYGYLFKHSLENGYTEIYVLLNEYKNKK